MAPGKKRPKPNLDGSEFSSLVDIVPLSIPEFANICKEIACSDKSVVSICKARGFSHDRFWATINQSTGEGRAKIKELYAQARRDQIEALLDAINSLHNQCADEVKGIEDSKRANALVQAYRLKIDDYKWRASKLLPRMYGDVQYIEINEITGQIVNAIVDVIRQFVPSDRQDQAINALRQIMDRSGAF